MHSHSYNTESKHAGKRLDAFLAEQLSGLSREKIKKAIQSGHCLIDGLINKSPSVKLKLGQYIEITLYPPTDHLVPEAGELELIWHDENIAICNKPAGITVHPCPSCPEGTYIQRLAAHFPSLLLQEGLRPGIVHRIDKDTSGLLIVALTEAARLKLAADFAERRVEKVYLALVHGVPEPEGEIKSPIGRHPQSKIKMTIVEEKHGGRPAHSAWQVLYADPQKRFALVQVIIFTGRTHQIRVHMAHLGFPLWGDAVYSPKITNNIQVNKPAKRQMLHAWKLGFTHPLTGEKLAFCCQPPQDMLDCAISLTKNTKKIIITGLAGCGKSSLLKEFSKLGIPTWSADCAVKKLYTIGGAGHSFFIKRFGKLFVPHPKAELNREALRKAMQDPKIRQEVNANIHTLVYEDSELFWKKCQENGEQFGVAEVPLYFENGRHNSEHAHIIGVECLQKTRYTRLITNRNWTEEQCQEIDTWQWAEDKKMSACHTVINNNTELKILAQAAKNIVTNLKTELKKEDQTLSQHLQSLWL